MGRSIRYVAYSSDVTTSDTPAVQSILDAYVRDPPSDQVAVDLFGGEWTSAIPIVGLRSGGTPLFADSRIHWVIDQIGNMSGMNVVELGPLEGGHTYMLDKAGASVTAIEANMRGYLKCLVVKELLQMQHSRFLLGDFLPFLEETPNTYDLLLASGVIYHAPDPIRLLEAMGRTSDRVAIWTHFFDPHIIGVEESRSRLFTDEPEVVQRAGRTLTLHRRQYLEALEWDGFCGGPETSALWMEKDGLLGVLEDVGFVDLNIQSIDLDHPFGPCIMLLASKAS